MSFKEEIESWAGGRESDIEFIINIKDMHCLDKQKVKEAIMRLPDDNRRYILLKELDF